MVLEHAGWSLCLLIDQTASEPADRFCGFMCYQLSSKSAEFHIARIAVIARRSNSFVSELFSLRICRGSCWLGYCSNRIVVILSLQTVTPFTPYIHSLHSIFSIEEMKYCPIENSQVFRVLLRTLKPKALGAEGPDLLSTRSRGKGYGKHFMQWALEKCSLLPRSACAWQLSHTQLMFHQVRLVPLMETSS